MRNPVSTCLCVSLYLFALTATAPASTAQPRHTGTFAVGIGDGDDGCVFRWRTRTEVRAWPHPTTTIGRPIRTVARGRLVEGNDRSEALTVTLRAGHAEAGRDVSFEATDYGAATYLSHDDYYESGRTATVRLSRGEPVELLAGGPEGTEFFRVRGRVYSGHLPEQVAARSQPVTRLWVRLTPRGRRFPAAWVNVDDAEEFAELECDY